MVETRVDLTGRGRNAISVQPAHQMRNTLQRGIVFPIKFSVVGILVFASADIEGFLKRIISLKIAVFPQVCGRVAFARRAAQRMKQRLVVQNPNRN